jgi:predicted DNA-binding transcriptional regulator YafY
VADTTNRVLALLNLLQSHRQWSGSELAGRLGVTGRTMRRDVERLRELGYRIEATRGATGGYRLEAGAQLPPLLLTDDEAVTMAIGLRLVASQGLADGEQTTLSALAKFEQVLPSALQRRVSALAQVVRSRSPRGEAVSPELLGRLALICRDAERIRFRYTSGGGAESRRIVEPHSVVSSSGRWFLVGWDLDRVAWRTFRVDRMDGLLATGRHFTPREPAAGDVADFASGGAAPGRRFSAEVVLAMPIAAMRATFGEWASGVVEVDAGHTSWPISGDSPEVLLSALVWVPAGVAYELRGDPEFLAFAAESTARMHASVRQPEQLVASAPLERAGEAPM